MRALKPRDCAVTLNIVKTFPLGLIAVAALLLSSCGSSADEIEAGMSAAPPASVTTTVATTTTEAPVVDEPAEDEVVEDEADIVIVATTDPDAEAVVVDDEPDVVEDEPIVATDTAVFTNAEVDIEGSDVLLWFWAPW